jgi:L-ascorbate metabolism protein UlaG (beta-lactamase superfamily)
MKRARGWWWVAVAVGVLAWSAFELGWLTPAADWPEATGWRRIPPELRADPTPLWQDKDGADTPPDLRWLGHAGFELSWHGTRLLLDPNTSARCTVARRLLEAAMPASEIPAVDAVLLSHAHFDHLDLPTLRALAAPGAFVVPAGSEDLLEPLARGGASIVGIRPGQSLRLGSLVVTAVPADHNGGRLHPLHSRRLAVGYVVDAGGSSLYYAGDTGVGAPFAAIAREHRPRAAVLPIGAHAPAWPIGLFHLSPEQAVAVARDLGVESVVPSHFGTFRLALDRPDSALPRFAAAAHREGVHWLMPLLWTERGGLAETDPREEMVAWSP